MPKSKNEIVRKPERRSSRIVCPHCVQGKIGGRDCIACGGSGFRTL